MRLVKKPYEQYDLDFLKAKVYHNLMITEMPIEYRNRLKAKLSMCLIGDLLDIIDKKLGGELYEDDTFQVDLKEKLRAEVIWERKRRAEIYRKPEPPRHNEPKVVQWTEDEKAYTTLSFDPLVSKVTWICERPAIMGIWTSDREHCESVLSKATCEKVYIDVN